MPFSHTPCMGVCRPVMRLLREGLHTGEGVWPWVNMTPSAARRSVWGEWANELPMQLSVSQRWVSVVMSKRLGCSVMCVPLVVSTGPIDLGR